jgi:hypothetical protein
MSEETALQNFYARGLEASSRFAFGAALAAFAVYASGLLPSFVPFDTLAALWHLPVDEFRARTGAPAQWDWIRLLGYADYLNLACVALICSVTLACYAAMWPVLVRQGERLQAALVGAQLLVLLIAASGALTGTH